MIPSTPPTLEWVLESHPQDFELRRRIEALLSHETQMQTNLAELYRATSNDLRGQLTNMRRAYEAALKKPEI